MKLRKSFLPLLLMFIVAAGCAGLHRQTTDGSTPAPITPLERANFDNYQIAVHNRAVAKSIIAVHDSGFMETEYFDTLSAGQIKITRIHEQLTPLLAKPVAADSAQIKALLGQIKDIAVNMVKNGALGIKNTESRDLIAWDISAIASLADSITSTLTTAGILK